ncbi:hypothetical protein MKQ68_08625 [Chitinophaga horti]|uniref:YhhN-like protein n=1 Tax=Chitinophaga horti TaxID=2920382 RepID=A0ABY6J647_9BACT|nr:hypothetical protein [Chitinophaga horti]UYQ95160.1 hypothetical protein MKQ68_08625 [Chitinophaga horti]
MGTHLIIFYFLLGIEFLVLIPFSLRFATLAKNERWIFYYLAVSFVFAAGSKILQATVGNNMLFVNLMTLLQFYLLSMYYFTVIKSQKVHRVIGILLAGITVLFIADILFIEGSRTFNSIFSSARTLVLLIYGIIFFMELQKDEQLLEQSIFINMVPDFWFNAGLFVYLCCSFILTLGYNLMQRTLLPEDMKTAQSLTMSLHYIGGVVEIIFFYVGFLKIKRVSV